MAFADRYGPCAIIAGASTGLGAAFAEEAAARGLDLVLIARRGELMRSTADAIRSRHPVEIHCLEVDLARPDIVRVVGEAVSDLDVGLLVYNAAAEPQGRFLTTSTDDLLANIAVNVTTPTLLVREIGVRLAARGRGGVVLVSSTGALQGTKIFVPYGASKAYELILGEGLWDEFREHDVDAFAYVVGATATPTYLHNASKLDLTPELLESLARDSGQATNAPRSCEEVAANLFAVLDREGKGIGPRHYSHPDDEARALSDAIRPRAEVVSAMGRMTSALWR
jgi:uncharacterized protein